jgi:hypothetical protein
MRTSSGGRLPASRRQPTNTPMSRVGRRRTRWPLSGIVVAASELILGGVLIGWLASHPVVGGADQQSRLVGVRVLWAFAALLVCLSVLSVLQPSAFWLRRRKGRHDSAKGYPPAWKTGIEEVSAEMCVVRPPRPLHLVLDGQGLFSSEERLVAALSERPPDPTQADEISVPCVPPMRSAVDRYLESLPISRAIEPSAR